MMQRHKKFFWFCIGFNVTLVAWWLLLALTTKESLFALVNANVFLSAASVILCCGKE